MAREGRAGGTLRIQPAAMAILIVFPAVILAGCGRQQSGAPGAASLPGRVARQAAAPTIASDVRLDKFVGEWADKDGELVVTIKRCPDGSGFISSPPNDTWDEIFNNVRFEADTLRYNSYHYYRGEGELRTISNPLGDHPFSGVRMEVTLSRGDLPDTLKERAVTKDLPSGVEGVLHRYNDKATVRGRDASRTGDSPSWAGREGEAPGR